MPRLQRRDLRHGEARVVHSPRLEGKKEEVSVTLYDRIHQHDPLAAVLWDRDTGGESGVDEYELSINVICGWLTVMWPTFDKEGIKILKWWHFVYDPVPHWVEDTVAWERGYGRYNDEDGVTPHYKLWWSPDEHDTSV